MDLPTITLATSTCPWSDPTQSRTRGSSSISRTTTRLHSGLGTASIINLPRKRHQGDTDGYRTEVADAPLPVARAVQELHRAPRREGRHQEDRQGGDGPDVGEQSDG